MCRKFKDFLDTSPSMHSLALMMFSRLDILITTILIGRAVTKPALKQLVMTAPQWKIYALQRKIFPLCAIISSMNLSCFLGIYSQFTNKRVCSLTFFWKICQGACPYCASARLRPYGQKKLFYFKMVMKLKIFWSKCQGARLIKGAHLRSF